MRKLAQGGFVTHTASAWWVHQQQSRWGDLSTRGWRGGDGDMGPGGQGLGTEMDWIEQAWKQPKMPCLTRSGQSGEPDVAQGLHPWGPSPVRGLASCSSQIN